MLVEHWIVTFESEGNSRQLWQESGEQSKPQNWFISGDKALFTAATSSLIKTWPSALQSPHIVFPSAAATPVKTTAAKMRIFITNYSFVLSRIARPIKP